jgi:hypothetical protein
MLKSLRYRSIPNSVKTTKTDRLRRVILSLENDAYSLPVSIDENEPP